MKRDDMRASRGARTDESEEGAVPVSSSDDIRVHAVVAGLVQGVGFRYFTVMTAGKLGLGGWVRNCYDGSVEVEAQGTRQGRPSDFGTEAGAALCRCRTSGRHRDPAAGAEAGPSWVPLVRRVLRAIVSGLLRRNCSTGR